MQAAIGSHIADDFSTFAVGVGSDIKNITSNIAVSTKKTKITMKERQKNAEKKIES